ncbi:MAG: aspartyl-phosphate phosphatase Spo0E family protein [Alkaliphilus sp.]|nr:aspartyl-phosphate phosphatase Spo0E family protein [Alkaliphilus sp.]
MGNKECERTQIENLKNRLNKMLKESDGRIDKDIIEVSKELDKLILQEFKNKKK